MNADYANCFIYFNAVNINFSFETLKPLILLTDTTLVCHTERIKSHDLTSAAICWRSNATTH